MDRRNLIKVSAFAVTAAAANVFVSNIASAAEKAKSTKGDGKAASPNDLDTVIAATTDCITKGETCLAFCMSELAKGDTKMAKCNRLVYEMLVTCEAMRKLASSQSALAKKMAGVCADACKSCHDACAEHKEHFAHGMHLPCKACMESCADCEKACRALAA